MLFVAYRSMGQWGIIVTTDVLNRLNSVELKERLRAIFQKNREKQRAYQKSQFFSQFTEVESQEEADCQSQLSTRDYPGGCPRVEVVARGS